MKNNWKVQINNEGNLVIAGKATPGQYQNLFGVKAFESGLCVYAHNLRPVRILLDKLFPSSTIRTIEAMEEIIREEFCNNRSVTMFKQYLEKAQIPYRAFSRVA
ncbi:hypothetical protein N9L92_03735 [Saprospiraceae bacterium]|nr:hypothetical protein [Saprospiraceae bacterium]